jgi:ribonuclease P protein component
MTAPAHPSRAFPRALRLSRARDFRAALDHGRSRSDGRLVVYCHAHGLGPDPRLGLVVGRRYGGAVFRNAFKRRVREAFRLHRERLPPGHDVIVLPARPGVRLEVAEIAERLVRLAALAVGELARRGPR